MNLKLNNFVDALDHPFFVSFVLAVFQPNPLGRLRSDIDVIAKFNNTLQKNKWNTKK